MKYIYSIPLSLIGMVLFSWLPLERACSEEAGVVTRDSLVLEGLENNPGIRASYNEWQAAKYKVKEISSLPDPMARYTYLGESVETRNGPQEHKFGVSQKVPFPLKLYYKGKAASRHADMLKEEYEASKRKLMKEIEFLYYDLFWLDKALEILSEEKSILENLEKVARAKFEGGSATQQDTIKAGVEISKILDKIYMLKQQRGSKRAMMNSLLSRSVDRPLGKTENVEPRNFTYNVSDLRDIASRNRQELLKSNLNVERAQYEKSLSYLDFMPDFSFGFDYITVGSGTTMRQEDGNDAWMTTFGVTVPIWFDKQVAQVKEKSASLEAAKNGLVNTQNAVAYEIEDVYFKITTYRDIVSLYKTALIPQTRQAFEAARTGYETGRVDFLNWLDSERVLLQTRLAYYKAIVDYEKSISYLKRIVGTDI
jgi:outer membrane protein TolC